MRRNSLAHLFAAPLALILVGCGGMGGERPKDAGRDRVADSTLVTDSPLAVEAGTGFDADALVDVVLAVDSPRATDVVLAVDLPRATDVVLTGDSGQDVGPALAVDSGQDVGPALAVDTGQAVDVVLAVDTGQAVDVASAVDSTLAVDTVSTLDSGLSVDTGWTDTPMCAVLPARFDADTIIPKGCYLAQTSPAIAAAVRLTLEPGVTIIFSANTGLAISADQVLVAAGTAEDPILLTGAWGQRGYWEGVFFDGTLTESVLDHVTVEYAGSTKFDEDAAAVKMTADSRGVRARITNTVLRESEGWGLFLASSALIPEFGGNTLTKNQLGPVKVASEAAHQLLPASLYTGNDVDQVAVTANRVSAVTWLPIGVPYVLDGVLHVDLVWTLAPGVVLLIAPASAISVLGDAAGLHAVGTAAAPILISGTVKTSGTWESIIFNNTLNTANAFDHCIIEYGGAGILMGDWGMIMAESDSHGVLLSVTNSTIQYSGLAGLWVGRYAQVTLFNNTYNWNTASGVYFQP